MEAVLTAAVTAIGAVTVAVVGYVVNRRMGLPGEVQRTIRSERVQYEKALERKASRLEDELAEERHAREQDKVECMEQIERLADQVVDKNLLIGRLEARIAALEAKS